MWNIVWRAHDWAVENAFLCAAAAMMAERVRPASDAGGRMPAYEQRRRGGELRRRIDGAVAGSGTGSGTPEPSATG